MTPTVALYPEIPSYLRDPIVFRDKNLGIAMVAYQGDEQWIYKMHGDHWCSVRKVGPQDPMFILEKIN